MTVLDRFEIVLEDPGRGYKPDEEVSGRVVLKAKAGEVESKGLTIKFTGKSIIIGRSGGKKGRRLQNYFDTTPIFLVGDGSSAVEVVKSGQQISFPFSFQLPCGCQLLPLPSSLEAQWGNVEYYLEAELDLTPYKKNETAFKSVQVISPLNLNYIPEIIAPVQAEASKTFCCTCSGMGSLTLTVTLPKGGFTPEEKIPFQVKVENKSGRKIKRLTAAVGERIHYRRFSDIKTRYEKDFGALLSDDGFIVRPGDTGFWSGELEIPQLPPTTTLEHESVIIGVEYFFVVQARASGVSKRFPVFCPIVIGTVPIPLDSTASIRSERIQGAGENVSRPVSRTSAK
ncbi:Arrestin domain-containing protein 3 [Orchesella cincta]|uniref:Arrestin domain-containing protein 3 n=1 Tax=Orchesella cincta TaxID=48709 RepID=A0A1D2MWM7_ORCCI|nr:Arrestin domain-containing protein 3 [Orchesella cincta]